MGYRFCQWHAEPSACKICLDTAKHKTKWGIGIYEVDNVPSIPAHPNCRCAISAYWVDDEKIKNDKVISRLERRKNIHKRIAVNKERQRKLTDDFRKKGGLVWQNADSEFYLESRKAAAITLNEVTIALRKKPTISEVLEELYHAEQFRRGEIGKTDISKYKAEIKAQEYLLSVRKLYNIPKEEIEETKKNLIYWKNLLKEAEYEN